MCLDKPMLFFLPVTIVPPSVRCAYTEQCNCSLTGQVKGHSLGRPCPLTQKGLLAVGTSPMPSVTSVGPVCRALSAAVQSGGYNPVRTSPCLRATRGTKRTHVTENLPVPHPNHNCCNRALQHYVQANFSMFWRSLLPIRGIRSCGIQKNDGQTGSCAWTRQCWDKRVGGGIVNSAHPHRTRFDHEQRIPSTCQHKPPAHHFSFSATCFRPCKQ